jgi:D-glycero-alpha-D-manno-heptose-7-phosphate kinase
MMKITRTPLRFSLIGGGSDIPAYFTEYGPCKIISMTLEQSIYVTYTKRDIYRGSAKDVYGHNIRLSYTRTENVYTIDEIEHELVRETLKSDLLGGWLGDAFEMTTIGDVPSRGAGLGSSSALIVGVLKLFKYRVDADTLASYAAQIEIDKLGKPIGYQDHMSAAYGGLRKYCIVAVRLNDAGGRVPILQSVQLPESPGYGLARRLLAFRLPADRSEKAAVAPAHDTLAYMQETMKQKARYIKETVDLVDYMYNYLQSEDWEGVGNIMREGWDLKKRSHGVVDESIERWYNMGIDAGALAGKVSGSMSGGAGHLFFLCYPDMQDAVRKAVGAELSEMSVKYYAHGSTLWEI